MKHRLQHLTCSISLGICIALGGGDTNSADPKPEPSPLTASGKNLPVQNEPTLTVLPAEIAGSLRAVHEQLEATFQAARRAVRTVKADVHTAQQTLNQIAITAPTLIRENHG